MLMQMVIDLSTREGSDLIYKVRAGSEIVSIHHISPQCERTLWVSQLDQLLGTCRLMLSESASMHSPAILSAENNEQSG
jgi:hypothetical protein